MAIEKHRKFIVNLKRKNINKFEKVYLTQVGWKGNGTFDSFPSLFEYDG